MKTKENKYISVLAILFLFAASVVSQTTEFTYQGKLTDAGTPSATYDFVFRLCDSLAGDCTTPLATQQSSGVAVTGGVFTVSLDFGAAVFDGSGRWLEVAVKRPAQPTFTTLTPRQPLTSAPYSVKALKSFDAENLGGVPAVSFLFFREVDHDRRALEQGQRLAARSVRIDDGGNAVVRRDGEEFRPKLLALADIDRDDLVGDAQLFEGDMHLVAVRRGPGPDFDHGASPVGGQRFQWRPRSRAVRKTVAFEV